MERDYRNEGHDGTPFNELYVALETEETFRKLLIAFDGKYLKSVIYNENILTDRDAYDLFSFASYYENISVQVLERGGEQYRGDVNKLLILAAEAFEKITISFCEEVTRQLDSQISPALHAALCYTVCLNHQNAYTVLNNLYEQIKHLGFDTNFPSGYNQTQQVENKDSDDGASGIYHEFQSMIFFLLTRRYKQASRKAYSLLKNPKNKDKVVVHITNAVKALTEYMLRGRDSWELFYKSIDLVKRMELDALYLFIVQVLYSFGTQAKKYSIWSHLYLDNRYMRYLVDRKNVIELWESQLDAINKNCLNSENAVLSFPTSSGKTLIAEFKSIDFLTFYQKKVVYLVPTKALGQQVFRSIKSGIESIEKVAGLVMNITDKIDSSIFSKSDFVVLTPEKLELMIRNQPEIIESIGLVIVDEFHSISEDSRGLKLDFLLYRLRKNKNINYFFLSAVIPNVTDVAEWIKGEPINLEWRPTKLIRGFRIKDSKRIFFSRIGNVDISVPKGVHDTIWIASLFERLGPVLIIDGTKEWVENKAIQFRNLVQCEERISKPRLELNGELKLLLGEDHPLCELVKFGVAYHHADLESDAKLLIENALKKRIISTIFATTTLAEGVDFPVKSVILSTLYQYGQEISHRLLNNIAGRAGRAGYYNEGYAIIICPPKWEPKQAVDFWRTKNEPIYSVLSDVAKAIEAPEEHLYSWVKTRSGWERRADEAKVTWFNRILGVLESYLWALSSEGMLSLEDESINQLFQDLFIIEPEAIGSPMKKLQSWVVDKRQYVEQLSFAPEIQKILIGSGFSLQSSEMIYNSTSNFLSAIDSVKLNLEFISWFVCLAVTLEETKPKKKFKDIRHSEFLLKWIQEGSIDEAVEKSVGKATINEYIATQVRFSFAWLAFTIGKVIEEIIGEKECFPLQYFSDFVRYGTNNPIIAILFESGFDKFSAFIIASHYRGQITGNKTKDTTSIWLWLAFQDINELLKNADSENYKVRKNIIEKIVDFDVLSEWSEFEE